MLRTIAISLLSLALSGCVTTDPHDFLAIAHPEAEPTPNRVLTGVNIELQPTGAAPKAAGYVRVINVSTRGDGTPRPRAYNEIYSYMDVKFEGDSTDSTKYVAHAADQSLLSNEIKENYKADQVTGGDVFIYIHGYNNSVNDALTRAAQLGGSLERAYGFHGTTIAFTWPSAASTSKYMYDLQSSTFSRDTLSWLLYQVAKDDNVKRINIVAHSMGNWLTMEALRQTAIAGAERRNVFNKIVRLNLVEADIDIDVFAKQVAIVNDKDIAFGAINWFGMASYTNFVTKIRVFANQNDNALKISASLASNPRLGNLTQADFNAMFGVYNMAYTSTIGAKKKKWDLTNLITNHWPLDDPFYINQVAQGFQIDGGKPSLQANR